MINLIPTDLKEQMRYARRNRILLHWCVAVFCVIAGLCVTAFFGHFYISNSEKNLRLTVDSTNQRIEREKLPESQKEYTELANGVRTVMQILSKQVLFSQLIPHLGAALPEGAVLTGLTLTPEDVALDLMVGTRDEKTAAQTQVNFTDPANQLFEEADIVSLTCAAEGETATTAYPCEVSIRALYKKDATFLFLNSLGDNAQ